MMFDQCKDWHSRNKNNLLGLINASISWTLFDSQIYNLLFVIVTITFDPVHDGTKKSLIFICNNDNHQRSFTHSINSLQKVITFLICNLFFATLLIASTMTKNSRYCWVQDLRVISNINSKWCLVRPNIFFPWWTMSSISTRHSKGDSRHQPTYFPLFMPVFFLQQTIH